MLLRFLTNDNIHYSGIHLPSGRKGFMMVIGCIGTEREKQLALQHELAHLALSHHTLPRNDLLLMPRTEKIAMELAAWMLVFIRKGNLQGIGLAHKSLLSYGCENGGKLIKTGLRRLYRRGILTTDPASW